MSSLQITFYSTTDESFRFHNKKIHEILKLDSSHILFVCLFVCLNKTRKTTLRLLCWEGSKHSGSDHTRAETQTTCVPKTAAHTTTYLNVKKTQPTNNMHESCSWTYVHERTITSVISYLNQARQQCVSPPVFSAMLRQPPWLQRVVYVWLVSTWMKDLACDGRTAVHSPFSFIEG